MLLNYTSWGGSSCLKEDGCKDFSNFITSLLFNTLVPPVVWSANVLGEITFCTNSHANIFFSGLCKKTGTRLVLK